MKNDGTEAQDLFIERMKAMGHHVFRLRDAKDVRGLNKGKSLAMFTCPADYLVAGKDMLALVEVKSTWNETRFEYKDIRPAQRAAACICASLGAPYLFGVYSMKHKKWFQLRCEQFAADIKAGIKSRKFEDMETDSVH